ncbi:MAG: general secretion pathway protein GspB [Psychromonas sp.]|nr:general secretion pathway protein GspB [Alteromonadales bacterium]MCP5078628.1 general secretion pathway protein GspB [Psychromonas sp.]
MSTILQALQKSKFDQAGGPPPLTQPAIKVYKWKIAISLALFTIIALLGTLVYLLLNPQSEPKNNTAMVQPAMEQQLVKVTFETKPLPAPAEKINKQPNKVVKKEKPIATPVTANKGKELVAKQTNDDDAPSSDLKKRFELAMLLTEIEQDKNPVDDITHEEGMNDGSDIREMSSDFQDKVPLIRYDSHMYSSVVADRWIRINGEILTEGEFDSTGQLELIEIQPQRSIFRLERQSFSVESLTDWKGY